MSRREKKPSVSSNGPFRNPSPPPLPDNSHVVLRVLALENVDRAPLQPRPYRLHKDPPRVRHPPDEPAERRRFPLVALHLPAAPPPPPADRTPDRAEASERRRARHNPAFRTRPEQIIVLRPVETVVGVPQAARRGPPVADGSAGGGPPVRRGEADAVRGGRRGGEEEEHGGSSGRGTIPTVPPRRQMASAHWPGWFVIPARPTKG